MQQTSFIRNSIDFNFALLVYLARFFPLNNEYGSAFNFRTDTLNGLKFHSIISTIGLFDSYHPKLKIRHYVATKFAIQFLDTKKTIPCFEIRFGRLFMGNMDYLVLKCHQIWFQYVEDIENSIFPQKFIKIYIYQEERKT